MAEMPDLSKLGVAGAAALLARRDMSAPELTEAYLRRILALNSTLNAYVTVTAERAREDAIRAQAALDAGTAGPLTGVPVALKDLFDTAGVRTAAGAKVYHDRVPAEDSAVARRLHRAGAVLLGKLNTHELAYGVTTNNPHFGPTRNPWDIERVPGGSSGGSGAAVAAGMAAATMGTDTGGSIRIPAALCGVVGLKPTYGRVSLAGVMPLSPSFDHAGPIVRFVEDAAILLQVVAGDDPASTSHGAVERTTVSDDRLTLGGHLRGLRVGVPRAAFYERLDPEVERAVERALVVLHGLGAEVRDVETPPLQEAARAVAAIILAEARAVHADLLATRPGDLGDDVRAALSRTLPSEEALAAARQQVQETAAAFRRLLETVDVLVTPATSVPAPRIGDDNVLVAGEDRPVLATLVRLTSPFNISHLPAISVPCGFTESGLPLGLQIAGRPFDEATVLRVAYAYEQATDWHVRVPLLS